ncbi:MAG: hypothetical protein JST93_31175 [Acidobacteria bacterium]|nr:hypothetical protein [Acidobacteriota bacterium]
MKNAGPLFLLIALTNCSGPTNTAKPPEKQPPEYFRVDPSTAGTVFGKVSFEGKLPARQKIDLDEDDQCVKLNPRGMFDASITVNKNRTLSNVFVYVKTGLEGKTFPKLQEPVVLDQRGCQFSPRVFALRAGQPFHVANSDPVTHNVHPIAKMNREWNQSQSPGDAPLQRKFVRPEIMIRIKCNVHSWMRSWAAVMDHPYYAITATDGSFAIPNLPPGQYTLEAWHEKLGTQEQKIRVDPSAKVQTVFQFQGEN